MPILVGTEMNKAGQPFVDDFHAPELALYVEDFLAGARWAWEETEPDLNSELGKGRLCTAGGRFPTG